MATSVLMVQGTSSDAGKSLLVAGLCRLLARQGINVAPFKPQNMALNSAVTADGGEIGRAQALQAAAAKIAPTTDMNPILIKPESDQRAQIIVHGKQLQAMDASDYQQYKSRALDFVLESFSRLSERHDVIVVEGAGSPAEINLRENDIANMGFAEAVDCPVLLVADIDRGGVFASTVGTLQLLSESEQKRICGVVINKFRGDIGLLIPGLEWLEKQIDKPVLGVLPYLHNLHLDAEDALSAHQLIDSGEEQVKVAVVVFPRISNHTDFDPLRLHPQVDFHYVTLDQRLPPCDLVILPGTKNVREDLARLNSSALLGDLRKHLRYGGKILGICGGLQMLGTAIHDPSGIESTPGSSDGLGLLELTTTLNNNKSLQQRDGNLLLDGFDRVPVSGYEIHCGISSGPALDKPLIEFSDGSKDGAVSSDLQIAGSYLHGIFDQADCSAALLSWAGLPKAAAIDIERERERQLERLADMIGKNLQLAPLFSGHTLKQQGEALWNA